MNSRIKELICKIQTEEKYIPSDLEILKAPELKFCLTVPRNRSNSSTSAPTFDPMDIDIRSSLAKLYFTLAKYARNSGEMGKQFTYATSALTAITCIKNIHTIHKKSYHNPDLPAALDALSEEAIKICLPHWAQELTSKINSYPRDPNSRTSTMISGSSSSMGHTSSATTSSSSTTVSSTHSTLSSSGHSVSSSSTTTVSPLSSPDLNLSSIITPRFAAARSAMSTINLPPSSPIVPGKPLSPPPSPESVRLEDKYDSGESDGDTTDTDTGEETSSFSACHDEENTSPLPPVPPSLITSAQAQQLYIDLITAYNDLYIEDQTEQSLGNGILKTVVHYCLNVTAEKINTVCFISPEDQGIFHYRVALLCNALLSSFHSRLGLKKASLLKAKEFHLTQANNFHPNPITSTCLKLFEFSAPNIKMLESETCEDSNIVHYSKQDFLKKLNSSSRPITVAPPLSGGMRKSPKSHFEAKTEAKPNEDKDPDEKLRASVPPTFGFGPVTIGDETPTDIRVKIQKAHWKMREKQRHFLESKDRLNLILDKKNLIQFETLSDEQKKLAAKSELKKEDFEKQINPLFNSIESNNWKEAISYLPKEIRTDYEKNTKHMEEGNKKFWLVQHLLEIQEVLSAEKTKRSRLCLALDKDIRYRQLLAVRKKNPALFKELEAVPRTFLQELRAHNHFSEIDGALVEKSIAEKERAKAEAKAKASTKAKINAQSSQSRKRPPLTHQRSSKKPKTSTTDTTSMTTTTTPSPSQCNTVNRLFRPLEGSSSSSSSGSAVQRSGENPSTTSSIKRIGE